AIPIPLPPRPCDKCALRDSPRSYRTKSAPGLCGFRRVLVPFNELEGLDDISEISAVSEGDTAEANHRAPHLLEYLNQVFSPKGKHGDISFDELYTIASRAYNKYMTQEAYDHALGETKRDPARWGKDGALVTEAQAGSEADNWRGDRQLANLILRLRDFLWYYELCCSISGGDSGRVMEVLKILRFVFWGGGATNYGNELLELACNFLYEYPEPLVTALMNNYLVNPSGRPGHWQELDLLQEHYNLWIKVLYNERSKDWDSEFLQNVVALNIKGFSSVRETVLSEMGFSKRSNDHSEANLMADFNRLGDMHREAQLFTFRAGRKQPSISTDTTADIQGSYLPPKAKVGCTSREAVGGFPWRCN
ncbi:hypothetical protein OE88DRAFT_1649347, partial [Heliocybe sulcata]